MKYALNFGRRAALTIAAAVLANAALAQSDKPLRIIVPLTPGSAVDTVARTLSPELGKALGRPVVVENLAGAGGTSGTAQLAKASRDGNTIGLVASGHVINPYIYKSIPYDTLKDFTPISVIATSPLVLVVHPSVPAKDLTELIALLKAEPDKYFYGSAGNGSVAQLATSLFAKEAGVAIKHVPYKGVGPMMTDLVGGQVQMAFIGTSAAQAQVAAGKVRAIAVSSAKRSVLLPNVPTVAEGGLKEFHYEPWIAVLAPAGITATQSASFAAAFKTALAAPSVQETLSKQGFDTLGNTPAQATAFFATELKRHEKLVKDSGAVLE